MTFTWQAGRQLASLQKGTTGVNYTYSSDGTRLTKTVNGVKTSYTWDGAQLVSQTTTGGDTLYFLYHGSSRVGLEYKGNTYYYIYNLQGDVVGLVNSNGTTVVSYTYDAWGNPESISGSMASTLGAANPFRYRSYYFDTESGLYYLISRYYDPVVGRFLNTDSAMGVNGDMATYNLYVYCGNNPIVRYDAGGMFWKEIWDGIKGAARKVIHAGNNLAIAVGIDTAAIGAVFLDMQKDKSGVYHANFDCWQQYFGYNDLYDFVFDIGTSMKTVKFQFSHNGTNYIIWAWKGDYINLGAGAELGIYYGNEPHWLVDKGNALLTTMWLSYEGQNIIAYAPMDYQWWITGFNPSYQNVNANQLTATFKIGFTDIGMYNSFKSRWGDDPRWRFFDPMTAVLTF